MRQACVSLIKIALAPSPMRALLQVPSWIHCFSGHSALPLEKSSSITGYTSARAAYKRKPFPQTLCACSRKLYNRDCVPKLARILRPYAPWITPLAAVFILCFRRNHRYVIAIHHERAHQRTLPPRMLSGHDESLPRWHSASCAYHAWWPGRGCRCPRRALETQRRHGSQLRADRRAPGAHHRAVVEHIGSFLVPFQLVPANPFENTLCVFASDAWTFFWPK